MMVFIVSRARGLPVAILHGRVAFALSGRAMIVPLHLRNSRIDVDKFSVASVPPGGGACIRRFDKYQSLYQCNVSCCWEVIIPHSHTETHNEGEPHDACSP